MKRRTLEQLRAAEDALAAKLLAVAAKLGKARARRLRAEKRQATESVRARYVETDATSQPCTTCDVDTGAVCIDPSGVTVPPHATRLRAVAEAALRRAGAGTFLDRLQETRSLFAIRATQDGPVHCERCGEELDEDKAVMLDLNLHTHEYRQEPWPEDESQGGFWFGKACATRVLKAKGQLTRIGRAAK